MNLTAQLLIAAAAGAVAGGLASLAALPSPAEAETGDAATVDVLEPRLTGLEQGLARQAETLEALTESIDQRIGALERQPVAAAPDAQLAAAGGIDLATAAEAIGSEADAAVTAQSLFDLLLSGGDSEELWRKARELGLSDELVALYEAQVEADPTDPELHVDLGEAYLQKIQEVGQSPLAGMWATKADGAFDAALELDPDHWDARMNKAVSLSFWPPIFGKQKDAVAQFEILIERQASLPPNDGHAQPYVLLGNLHWQRGDTEAAMAVWKDGAAKFPDSADLAEKLGG